jgi:hypothetical protein
LIAGLKPAKKVSQESQPGKQVKKKAVRTARPFVFCLVLEIPQRVLRKFT